jgi:hypothetical protein
MIQIFKTLFTEYVLIYGVWDQFEKIGKELGDEIK